MSLRFKLMVLFTLAVAAAAGATAWNAERYAARQYQQADEQRSSALVAQFRSELSEREAEVTNSIQTIADAESTVRMVLDLSGPQGDPSIYAGDARGLAATRQLDFLELATTDGSLISSVQSPDHIGTKETWLTHENDWNQRRAFLDRVELPDHVELGLIAVRMVHAGNLNLYIVGGRRLDAGFLGTLSLPEGMRALLYRNLQGDFVPAEVSDGQGAVAGAESFAPLMESMQKQPANFMGPNGTGGLDADSASAAPSVSWSADSGSAERFVAVPLTGKQGEFLGALLLGSPQGALVAMDNDVGGAALMVAAAGLVLAFFLSWWIAARVAQPLERLSEGIGEVTGGDWDAQVDTGGVREVRQPIALFNKMTKQLADERAGQVARERAAAWRQLAGQLAAELKTLLPPLQSAITGLARTPQQAEEDDGFAPESSPESSAEIAPMAAAMRQTLETLAACAGKLGEFAALPVPRLEAVNVNDAARAAVQLFEPQFSAIGRPPITPELYLDERAGEVRADPVLLRKVFEHLLLFVIEDMPVGGTFSIYTRRQDGMAHIVLSHSGASTPRLSHSGENRSRSLDRAARVSGIGLSLATVQSIVSSHGGKISIETAPLAGTTFYLDWPVASAKGSGAAEPSAPVFSDAPKQAETAVPEQSEAEPPHAAAEPQAAQKQDERREKEQREALEAAPAQPQQMEQAHEQPKELKEQPQLSAAFAPKLEPPVTSAEAATAVVEMAAIAPAAAEAPAATQPEIVEAERETRHLAAVIEEVIETPMYSAQVAGIFADGNENEAEYVKALDRALGLESDNSLIEVSVVSRSGAQGEMLAAQAHDGPHNGAAAGSSGDAVSQLFGLPVPTSAVVEAPQDNSVPRLFGVPVPASAVEAPQNDSASQLFEMAVPASAFESPHNGAARGQAEAERIEQRVAENQLNNLPEPATDAAPAAAAPSAAPTGVPAATEVAAKSSEEHAEQKKPDLRPSVAYSPLTYRG